MNTVNKAIVEYGNMIEIKTVFGDMRIIVNQDGTFRLITDLKVKQIKDVLAENVALGKYEQVVQVETFGYPND